MPIAMTESELQAFALAVLQLSFAGGVFGALCWSMFTHFLGWVADAVCTWEEKRIRIASARMRSVHGPLLMPGMSSSLRRAMVGVLRKRHADGGRLD